MIRKPPLESSEVSRDTQAELAALRKAHLQAMRRHIYGNVPMVSWKDGKVVEIPPSELRRMLEEQGVPLFGSPI